MNNDVRATSGTIPFEADDRKLGVVVGFDGSEHATRALDYAARTARRRQAALTVITAYNVPTMIYATLAAIPPEAEDDVRRNEAERILDRAREHLRDHPGEVAYRVVEGDSAGALIELSAEAQLLVIGARGRGGFLGRILGSVASELPAHAHCPTVVVPSRDQTDVAADGERFDQGATGGRVVVGIDGSGLSHVAALQAAQAAQDLGASLHAVMALPPLATSLIWYPELTLDTGPIIQERTAELESFLEAQSRWVKVHFPALEVTAEVKVDSPVTVLEQETRTALLTVMGTRGRGGVASLLLGSTSRGVLLHAEGPVMVVPDLADRRLDDQPRLPR